MIVKGLKHQITNVENEIVKTSSNRICCERFMTHRAIALLTFKSNIERGHCNASVEVILLIEKMIIQNLKIIFSLYYSYLKLESPATI